MNAGKGFQCLTQHANSQKHKKESATKLDLKQLKLTTGPDLPQSSTQCQALPSAAIQEAVTMYAPCDQATVAELMWTLYSIAHNYSFSSCDGLIDVFKVMFRNTSLPQPF